MSKGVRGFGNHLRKLRRSRQLTQEALAEQSDLSVEAVRGIEREAFSPSLETLGKLTEGLDVSWSELFDEFVEERPRDVVELCQYLSKLEQSKLQRAWRVLQSMFEPDETTATE